MDSELSLKFIARVFPRLPSRMLLRFFWTTFVETAVCIALYFSVNGQYASQGKLGAAVLANHAANDVSFRT